MSLRLDNIDTSSLSWQEMLALAERLQVEAQKEAQKEFDSTMNFLNEKLAKMDRTKTQAVQALITLMDDGERRQCLKMIRGEASAQPARSRTPGRLATVGGKRKEPSEFADWDGEARAVVGTTYALPDNPQVTYTRQAIGPVNKQFMAAIRGGAKWREMEVRRH